MRTGLIAGTLACVVAAAVFNFSPRRTRRSQRKEAKMRLAIITLGIIAVACVTHGAIQVPEGYKVVSLGQNFMGGFDYLPNGDIIGMYNDPMMAENAYIGIVDGNGDGVPAAVDKKYDLGHPAFGAFVKVSPEGSIMLFEDFSLTTFDYKIKRMDLSNYSVSELVPASGSFDGAFDLAFIDSGHCYISANPAGTTNKIFHLDIVSRVLKEVVSVANTYSGPVDVDGNGNLYYIKGKANPAPQPRDFTILRFNASDLAAVLGGAPVIGVPDAAVVADGLDGGYDVAWHYSGTIYVSDANNGKLYSMNPGAPVSTFASLPGDSGEGFSVISLYRRDQAFGPSTPTKAEMAVDYISLPGVSSPDVYRITSLPPPVGATVSATLLGEGDRFVLTVMAQPTSNPFDGYVVLVSPGGAAYSVTPRGLIKGITAYAVNVRGLAKEFKGKLLDITIPASVPIGTWTIYAGLVPGGSAPSPANAFALDSIEVTVE